MSWFLLSIITLIFWSGSDLFSKIGCRDSKDKYSHLKMITAVGLIMGIHALYEIFVQDTVINFDIILRYLPVSLLYILSMALGYVGLRSIELSVSSPICNSSGALAAIASIIFFGTEGMGAPHYIALILVCVGVVGLGFVEAHEDEELRAERQKISNFKYAKSWKALCLPIAYCILDAAGTFADSIALETLEEDSANVAYELTFLAAGVVCFVFVLIGIIRKKTSFMPKADGAKLIGGICETIGQSTYIFAIADREHFAMSAAIISAYCAASVIWSRIFLKEKLSYKHYIAITITVIGIVVMGILDM